jgi:hypothetical protein
MMANRNIPILEKIKKFILMILPPLILVLLTISNKSNVLSQKFNTFRSYEKEKIKPPQYGKKNLRHYDVKEYLDQKQLLMYKKRYSSNNDLESSDLFDSNWSGFEKKKNIKFS